MYKIVGIGEILWDQLPTGKVLGGAPANFCYHAQQLGAEVVVWSAIGKDALGKAVIKLLEERNIPHHISFVDYPTGVVLVDLKEGIPTYHIAENVAWDFIPLTNRMRSKIDQVDAICFGTLAQRSEASKLTIFSILKQTKANTLKVLDINLRQNFYSKTNILHSLQFANVLKLNEEELSTVAGMLELKGSEITLCKSLMNEFNLKLIALTKGAAGSFVFTEKEYSFLPTPTVKVVDTIGAGDSFTAALIMGFLQGEPLAKLHQSAVDIAAYVCTQEGATPQYGRTDA